MAERRLVVLDPAGLHARPAARIVQIASRFECRIAVESGGRRADVKSLIALLGLTIRAGQEIVLAAEGPDAEDALATLVSELAGAVAPSGEVRPVLPAAQPSHP